MKNQQGAPEALRLADLLRQQAAYHREVASDCDMRAENTINWGHGEVCCRAADELLRLHAYCQELEAQVILDCMTHGQQSAEIEHVVGDVSKNGAESNMAQQPAPSAAHVVADALADSQYLAGVSAGWNAANADDPNSALQKLHESRAGYLKPLSAARAPADSVTAPAGGGVTGPSRWTVEEILDGNRGIRWVTEGVIHGRPTDHDVREYLMRTPAMRGCYCDDCKAFYARTSPDQAADSVLEDAARWFAERDNVLQSFWVLLGEAEAHADNDNNPLLKHQVEGFYRQWNALNGTTLGPRWVTRAARKQGGA